MRNAFTMIELIFVIVIMGVLSTFAIPKFLGVAETTHENICRSFIGTLNRTVSHTIWADSLLEKPQDFNITVAKLEENIEEQNDCGTLVQYVSATEGAPFNIHIGNNDYSISGSAASGDSPAQWAMTVQ